MSLNEIYPNGLCPDCEETIDLTAPVGSECGNCGWVLKKPVAQDYYFMVDEENDTFFFVDKEFWAENECIKDCGHGDFDTILPNDKKSCFLNNSEWSFGYYTKGFENGPLEEGRQKLLAVGFTEIPNPWANDSEENEDF